MKGLNSVCAAGIRYVVTVNIMLQSRLKAINLHVTRQPRELCHT